jgi:hypothetical protein
MKTLILSSLTALAMSSSAFAFGSVPAKYVQPTPPTAAMKAHECQGYDGILSVMTRGTCPSPGATNIEHGTGSGKNDHCDPHAEH